MAIKVHEARFVATFEHGHRHLPILPCGRFAHLGAQMGIPPAQIEGIFTHVQAHFQSHLTIYWLAREAAMAAAADAAVARDAKALRVLSPRAAASHAAYEAERLGLRA